MIDCKVPASFTLLCFPRRPPLQELNSIQGGDSDLIDRYIHISKSHVTH